MALQPAARVLGRRSPHFYLLSEAAQCQWTWGHCLVGTGADEFTVVTALLLSEATLKWGYVTLRCCLYYSWIKCTRCSWGIWQGWILSLFESSFWWLSLVPWRKCNPSERLSSSSSWQVAEPLFEAGVWLIQKAVSLSISPGCFTVQWANEQNINPAPLDGMWHTESKWGLAAN